MLGIIPQIRTNLIPIDKNKRLGTKINVQWITIHNTANPTSVAAGERNWLVNPDNKDESGWHIAVDSKEAVIAIPINEFAYHAGNRTGNETSIGIEVCESGDQVLTWKHAVGLAAKLLYDHKFGVEKLRTHKSWSGKNCPRLILPKWSDFVKDVQETLDHIKKQNEPKPTAPEFTKVKIKLDNELKQLTGLNIEGRTFVGVRELLESLGYKVDWDAPASTIIVSKTWVK